MSVKFQTWLKNNRIEKLKEKLKDGGIEVLDDIRAIESMQDLDEFIKELDLKVVDRSKLKRAMLEVVQFGAVNDKNDHDSKNDSKKNDMDDEKKVEIAARTKMPSMIFDKNGQSSVDYHDRDTMKGLHQAPFYHDRQNVERRNRTILVVGATGTGKTTAINSMMNYLWNVEYNEKFRYKLIVENFNKSSTKSMTEDVTAYYIEAPKLDYSLCIVDTPGFGDTDGVERDDEIVKKIKKFFTNKIQEIDAICFTVRAPQSKLTAEQRYVFNRVLGLFGKDIVSNIFILINYCDAKKPPVLEALKEEKIPCDKYFKLNNSAFDLPDSAEEAKMGLLFWQMGMTAFDELFVALGKVKTKSLALTKQVLTRREQLETYIEGIDPLIRKGFAYLEQMRDQIAAIIANERKANSSQDFEIVTFVPEPYKKPTSKNTTICLDCPGNYTCHRDCIYSKNSDKAGCSAMRDGKCTVCPNKCLWTSHKNLPYTIEYRKKRQVTTMQGLKDRYFDAKSALSTADQIINGLKGELAKVEEDVNGLIDGVRKCVMELRRIALRPNVLTQNDYIDQMIANEKSQAKEGWKARVQTLEALKSKQNKLKEMHDDEFYPWKKYDDVQKFLQKHELDNIFNQTPKKKDNYHKNKWGKSSGCRFSWFF